MNVEMPSSMLILAATVVLMAGPTVGQEEPKPGNVPAKAAAPQGTVPDDRPVESGVAEGVPPAAETGVDPAEVTEPAKATVIAVRGGAEYAPAGTSALEPSLWKPVTVGLALSGDTQIKTNLFGFVQLSFEDETFVQIERASLVRIDEYVKSATQQTIRIDLRYGAIHGGSTELRFRSNLTVASPVATMAKRGTDGWRFASEAQTGRFEISLARHGLVEAMQQLSGDRVVSRLVRPGEYANVANIASMWMKQDIFDRAVKFVKPYAVTDADMVFAVRNSTTGLAFAAPGDAATLEVLAGGRRSTVSTLPRVLSGIGATTVRRPEGNFGTTPAR